MGAPAFQRVVQLRCFYGLAGVLFGPGLANSMLLRRVSERKFHAAFPTSQRPAQKSPTTIPRAIWSNMLVTLLKLARRATGQL